MNYIVFDLEWNCPNDFEERTASCGLTNEIVEIGAVKLNDCFETVSELRILVRPTFISKMHRRIASLTGVYDSMLRNEGVFFPEAYRMFKDWCGSDYMFLTWSMSDVPALAENMRAHGMDTAELPDVADVQRIFGREILRVNTQVSLESAVRLMNIRGDRAHDALNDARNTVRICEFLDLETYLDEYITHYYETEELTMNFADPADLLTDKTVMEIECPWCGEKMVCEEWLPGKHGSRIGYAACEEGDEFWVNLSWEKDGDHYRITRTLYDMSDDLWDMYCSRKDRFEQKQLRRYIHNAEKATA